MSSVIIRVAPDRLRYKLERVDDLEAPVWPGEWDVERRLRLEDTDKYKAIVQRYREGRRWEDTDLFRNIYAVRFERGETVRHCASLEALAAQYYHRVDRLYADLKAHGFRERIDGRVVNMPEVFLGRDGEVIASNEGNHRVAMAKVLGLPWILATVRTRHPLAPEPVPVRLDPVMPLGAEDIPAMTTPAERVALYEMAKASAPKGAIVELGVWLGAVTVYLAAAVRDAGESRVHSYDRFVWKPVHTMKAGRQPDQPMADEVRQNLGELARYVDVHAGDFREARWRGPIGALILDGPKRVKEITRTLPIFGAHLAPGARIGWQDFAHFPSYELVIVLETLEAAGAIRFERGIFPGTTVITEALRPIVAADVTAERLRLDRWPPGQIEAIWEKWSARLPAGQVPRFRCGAALFLCDQGYLERGIERWRQLVAAHSAEIVPKWQSLRAQDSHTIQQYPALDAVVPSV